MPQSNTHLRHWIYLQRFSSHLANEFLPYLDELRSGIIGRLGDDITEFSRSKLEHQLIIITNLQKKIYQKYTNGLNDQLVLSAINESSYEINAIIKTYPDLLELTIPANAKIESALYSAPFNTGNKSGVLLGQLIDNLAVSQISIIDGIIRQGWFEGQTRQQMVSAITNTLKSSTRRANEAIVRTAVNHTSQVARSIVWNDNSDIIKGWRFLAVLDNKTTSICAGISSLDKVYPLNYGPLPPRHVGCRSTTVPVLIDKFKPVDAGKQASFGVDGGKQVKGDLTYFEWLKTQPKSFVHDSIGVGKGDLLLSGKLSPKQFAEFGLNARFEPLTLTEMIAKDKRLNLNYFD